MGKKTKPETDCLYTIHCELYEELDKNVWLYNIAYTLQLQLLVSTTQYHYNQTVLQRNNHYEISPFCQKSFLYNLYSIQ